MGCVTVFVYSMDMAESVLGVQSVLNLADMPCLHCQCTRNILSKLILVICVKKA